MKKALLLFVLLFVEYYSFGQTSIKTKEIKITYSNGYEVFNVCVTGCSTPFIDTKEYFWYTDFSKIKSTKGGSGGSLLHGNYKFYDQTGNLRQDKSYYLGLSDGSEKNWDSLGNIVSHYKYKKGECIYMKFQNDEKYWIEFNGPILEEGTVRKVYNQYNQLITEELMLADFSQKVKVFYEGSGKIKEEYTCGFMRDCMSGKYTAYYENGRIEIEGQFLETGCLDVKVGKWNWYKADGTIEATQEYKAFVENWANGEIKVIGGYYFDAETSTWIKTGEWKWYTEDGNIENSINYD